MAEIGAALREARTRARIEIAQMEAQTKIRAKYLRALENEEWELLPGPTYVKSFLKTYGDMLGLDGRQLVAEYKSAREPFQAVDDIGQMSKHTGGRTNRNFAPPIGRWATIAVVLIVIIAGVGYELLSGGSGTPKPAQATTGTPALTQDSGTDTTAPASTKVDSVVVTATASVTVSVRAGKRIAVREKKLSAGQKTTAVRGRVVIVTADSRSVRLAVNGKRRTLPPSTGPITVVVSGNGIKKASPSATACRV